MPNYKQFLKSDDWKQTRAMKLLANPVCQTCGGKKRLHLHHDSYERLGFERENDLFVLCFYCHKVIHFKEGKKQTVEQTHSRLMKKLSRHKSVVRRIKRNKKYISAYDVHKFLDQEFKSIVGR